MPVKLSLKDPLVLVWATLMGLTALSLWMGAGHEVGGMSTRLATVLVLTVAFVKAAAVVAYFMEVVEARTVIRAGAVIWFVVAASVTIGMYLWA